MVNSIHSHRKDTGSQDGETQELETNQKTQSRTETQLSVTLYQVTYCAHNQSPRKKRYAINDFLKMMTFFFQIWWDQKEKESNSINPMKISGKP